MALDKEKRVLLQRFVSSARSLLSAEYRRVLEGVYGLNESSGKIEDISLLTFNTDQEYETAKILRARIDVYKESSTNDKDIVNQLVRELSFTTLNRFAALKIFEKRGIILESISMGYNSKGFQLYKRICDSSLGESYNAYRSYILSLFDELVDDLNSVFDRYNEFGVLFPRESILTELINLINDELLEDVWENDEALGWMYQYFNLDTERRAMREQSKNPRNSRELAVRNQFFTPRYVVESLVDNTLGRFWFESNVSQSNLNTFCRYLLIKNESASYTLPKDPRDIKFLDPACGSMHFGLYAFDVFERIYKEAWNLELKNGIDYFQRNESNKPLTEIYKDHAEYLRDIPRLIVENNINGVDIDSRAAQIAQLAIWLRAQKSWNDNSILYNDRPAIRYSNIVVAESIFVPESIKEDVKKHLGESFGVFEGIVEQLELAPTLGSLIRFNTSLEIVEFKSLFDEICLKILTLEKPKGVTFLDFYNFKDSIEKAKKFLYVLLDKYDAVLMNPPFGEAAKPTLAYLKSNFIEWNKNILCCFFEKSYEMLTMDGFVGAIYDRTANVKSTYEGFRKKHLIPEDRIALVVDLGWEVLDANVEVTSIVLCKNECIGTFIDLRSDEDKALGLTKKIQNNDFEVEKSSAYLSFPNSVIGYDFPKFMKAAFNEKGNLKEKGIIARQGVSLKTDKFYRNWWEVDKNAEYFSGKLFNGASFEPYYCNTIQAVVSPIHPFELPIDSSTVLRNKPEQFKKALGYGKRGEFLSVAKIDEDYLFTDEGQFIRTDKDLDLVMAYINTPIVRFMINRYCGQHKHSGYVNMLPFVDIGKDEELKSKITQLQVLKNNISKLDFLNPHFQFDFSPFESFQQVVNYYESCVQEYIDTCSEIEKISEELVEELFSVSLEEKKIIQSFKERQPLIKTPIIDYKRGRAEDYATIMILEYCLKLIFLDACKESLILTNRPGANDLCGAFRKKLVELSLGDNIEEEIVRNRGVDSLEKYFNSMSGFFADHLKFYTKNRRLSPLYWPISSDDNDLIIWLSYKNLRKDTIYKVINDIVSEEAKTIEFDIKNLRGVTDSNRIRLDTLLTKKASIEQLLEKLKVVSTKWSPSSFDGVPLNAAVLKDCFQNGSWKEYLEKIWSGVESGDFDWSKVALLNFKARVEEKINTDEGVRLFQEMNLRE